MMYLGLLLAAGSAQAGTPGGPLGLGLGGGLGVSGISGKYHIGEIAIQGVIGGNNLAGDDTGVGVGVDYLLEMPDLGSSGNVDFAWNCGFGGTLGIGSSATIGASGVVGFEILVLAVPLDIVIEYRPGAEILPDLTPDLFNFSSHVRYYF